MPANDSPMINFNPRGILRNAHAQVILATSGLRKAFLKRTHTSYLSAAQWLELDAGNGVTLAGELNTASATATSSDPANKNTLVIVLHGWEGSSQSAYATSAGSTLFDNGFDTFRLNFRDHGDTYHLNRGIFNSSLIDEVVGAVKAIQQQTHYDKYCLMGFSLGGNFALRVAVREQHLAKPLAGVLAVCPVLDPAHTMRALNQGAFFYGRYFAHKWKRSLNAKLAAFPDYKYGNDLKSIHTLDELNNYFIPRYTGFNSVSEYFKSYTLTGQKLAFLNCPSYILAAADDPIIPVSDFQNVAKPANLHITLTEQGSHCAYLENLHKPSAADKYAVKLFGAC
ncbi:YheT family hydrolase [Teredinibacter turnerae]|uniref:YheT family hydrolase n=1 Tax=Teredinibacter turnerae TaxID=2426 RepID=UPI0006865EB5|nr:alpha/beta fold hydrolase [Teredinibacter turnerae]